MFTWYVWLMSMFHAQGKSNHKHTFFCIPHYSQAGSIVRERLTRSKIHYTVPVSFRDQMYSDAKKKTSFHVMQTWLWEKSQP